MCIWMEQEKIQILNNLNQQHEMLSEQIKIVEQQIKEIAVFDRELDTLENNKDNTILAPLGKSVFAFMKPNLNEKFFVDVGAGYFVRKNINETKAVASEQKRRLESFKAQLLDEIQNVAMALEEVIIEHRNS